MDPSPSAHRSLRLDLLVNAEQAGPRGLPDPDVGVPRLHHQRDRVAAEGPARPRNEVIAAQAPVASDARVGHRPVEPRADLEPPRPVLGDDGGLERRQVRFGHAHQPALPHAGGAAVRIAETERPAQHPGAQVELLQVRQDLDAAQIQPVTARRAEREDQPVGQVHEVLVLDGPAGDLGPQPVVDARGVGAGIVDLVGDGLRGRSAGGEHPVPQGAERLSEPLLRREEALVGQRPPVHDGPRSESASISSSTNARASSVSRRV